MTQLAAKPSPIKNCRLLEGRGRRRAATAVWKTARGYCGNSEFTGGGGAEG